MNKNGKAFIVLPDGFFYRPADIELKKFIMEECFIKAIISLPEKTFYATSKKTYILSLVKKEQVDIKQNTPVFNAIAKTIGETLDANRIKTSDNDLDFIVKEYKKFLTDENGYKPDNLQIKVIPIKY